MKTEQSSSFCNSETLFGKLRTGCEDDWSAYIDHEFVRQLGLGTLPTSCFQYYLVQDYLFLISFARAYALGIYKSDSLRDMRACNVTLNGLLNLEMEMHISFCAEWGISEETMESRPQGLATLAYTSFVLERGMAGDALDLHVALAPCVIGYAEIGEKLAASKIEDSGANPYQKWINMYAGDEYRQVAIDATNLLERISLDILTPTRLRKLKHTFRQATLLETAFWDMCLR